MGALTLACRVASYAPFQDHAGAHLASLGVKAVEVHAPTAETAATVASTLRQHRLAAITVQPPCDLSRENAAEAVEQALSAAAPLSAAYCLLAPHPDRCPLPDAYARLRESAAAAARLGLTPLLEMHPPLAGNADQAFETLERVGLPAMKINFDTANIGFYNAEPRDVV